MASALQRVLFDFSILFPLLLCFGCCVLRCRVSLSLVRSVPCGFELVTQLSSGALPLYGCRCLGSALFFILTFNQGYIYIYIIFMTVVTQEVKAPEVCLTRIAWTEIEKAG